jgi:hypothetical protein
MIFEIVLFCCFAVIAIMMIIICNFIDYLIKENNNIISLEST